MSSKNEDSRTHLVQVGQIGEDDLKEKCKINQNDLPLLPTRNLVLFPGVTIPVTIVRDNALHLVEKAIKEKQALGIVCQKNSSVETPSIDDLYDTGVVADVLQLIPLPDGGKAAIVHAREKFKILEPGDSNSSAASVLTAKIKPVADRRPRTTMQEFELTAQAVKETAINLIKGSGMDGGQEFIFSFESIADPVLLVNMIATNFPFTTDEKIDLLNKSRLADRALSLLSVLQRDLELVELKNSIQERARQTMDEQKRSAYLQNQLEAIRSELYGDEDDAEKLLVRAEKVNFPESVKQTFEREVNKLRRLNPQTPDYSLLYGYLETLLDLPWCNPSEISTDFRKAEEILESEHYGLEKVKERILEQLAMVMHNPTGHAPIICLVGSPGVGKTSLGRSIAEALGREYQRVSFGGLHDEAEIRGHRRTYIGAMPGRIIDALKRCEHSNPVLLLDEIDKIGQDFKGDPAAALLEVLDPEQNCRFHDNYVDVDYDLSDVMFIATANTLSTISQPLLDRMEIIELSGYLPEEKLEIARRHLLPRQMKSAALTPDNVEVGDDALKTIIDSYTAESGVRQLDKNIAALMRKVVRKIMSGATDRQHIGKSEVRDLLGVEKYSRSMYENNDYAGVVAGLAWTSVGGEMLYIESSLSKAKGEKLTLTGNLGDVMKESAMIAYQFVKSHATKFGIDESLFEKYALHVHAPEGAVPKDGPSAGITITTSIVSAFTQKKVRANLAMTGEMTLRGKVLPVGGIKEKILAAKRAGITDIILSSENRKDIEEINKDFIAGLTFHFVENAEEVISFAITDEPAKDAVTL